MFALKLVFASEENVVSIQSQVKVQDLNDNQLVGALTQASKRVKWNLSKQKLKEGSMLYKITTLMMF